MDKNNLLSDYDEFVLANDSCYAPMFSFEKMFEVMSGKNVDFWGNTANCKKQYNNINHIQSYFVVFKKEAFLSDVFKNFIMSVKKQNKKEDVIANYECGLTQTLSDAGFSWDVYCEFSKNHKDSHFLYYKELIDIDKSPFLKRKIPILSTKLLTYLCKHKHFVNKYTNYDYTLIKECPNRSFIKEFFLTLWKIYRYLSERMMNNYL